MTSKLTLTVLATAAVLVAPRAYAQSTATQPAPNQTANQTIKQTKPAAAASQQTAAPKPAPVDKKALAKPGETAAHQSVANPHASKKEVPRIQPPELGRVPVDKQGSTFGFSSETKMKMYETPDGQRIRGLDHAITTNRQPTYFGLSLSVPTTSTSSGDGPPGLFPLPPRP